MFTRSRSAAWLAGLVALTLAVLLAGRVFPTSCPAQMAEAANPRPGLVLMAGDVSNPACTGNRKIRDR